MGFFDKLNRKTINLNRIYTVKETLQILKDSKYDGYTTEEVIDYKNGGTVGYRIIPREVEKQRTTEINERRRSKREFESRMSNNGMYKGIEVIPNRYNNYQSAKKYQQSEYCK